MLKNVFFFVVCHLAFNFPIFYSSQFRWFYFFISCLKVMLTNVWWSYHTSRFFLKCKCHEYKVLISWANLMFCRCLINHFFTFPSEDFFIEIWSLKKRSHPHHHIVPLVRISLTLSHAIRIYHLSLPVGLLDYIMRPYTAVVEEF